MGTNAERDAERGRHDDALRTLLEDLLARYPDDDSPQARAARAWLESHCRVCVGDTGGCGDLCQDCEGRYLRLRRAMALRRRERLAERER